MDPRDLWKGYESGKQTYAQLAMEHGCSIRTIQRVIDLHKVKIPEKTPGQVILLMDTTYWGKDFGVMLFKDAITKENLLKYYVKYETNSLYKRGVEQLEVRGFEIAGIVCDGRKGLIPSFNHIPVQMCQFHQAAIIRRYLTKNPKTPASIELKEITALMPHTDKESFVGVLSQWHDKWKEFLNERTTNTEMGKSFYTHKRLRSAYNSLKTNLKWLFTWQDHIELGMPNTTNAIDGQFANLKNKLRNHNGLSRKRKMKFIDEFLKA